MKLENKEGLPWTASTSLGWMVLIVALTSGAALIALAIYLALWIRSKGRSAMPLYLLALMLICSLATLTLDHITPASLVADMFVYLGAIIWIVAIYSLRQQILNHFKESEGWNLGIGPVLTFFFSSLYINYCLNPVALSQNNTITSLNLSNQSKETPGTN